MSSTIPVLKDDSENTFMLLMLITILTCVEETWDIVTEVCFKQSNWHGWVLSYINKHCFTHLKNYAKINDHFKSN